MTLKTPIIMKALPTTIIVDSEYFVFLEALEALIKSLPPFPDLRNNDHDDDGA